MKKLSSKLLTYKRIIIFLAIVIVALVLLFLNRSTSDMQALPDISIEKVTIRDVEKIVSVDGNLTGKTTREIFISQSEVLDLKVKVGSRVKKGTDLAVIEVTSFTGSEKQTIESPIAGIVTQVNIYEGENVVSSLSPAFVVVDDSSFIVEVEVNENDIPELKTKQTAELMVTAISLEDTYPATVSSIAPASSDTAVVSYLTTITPKELPEEARLGMSVEIDILTAKAEDVLAVPDSFIIEKDDKYLLKKLTRETETNDYSIDEVEVEIGLRTSDFVEIVSGVEEDDEIVEPSFTVERTSLFF